ncbi:glycosyltransferase family 2 protein [Pontiella sulfatireligans]|uniref:Glycosyltransferase EpsH n=1 Tax=Pontiella sulfatireligans TaxID=2750658 RepID=A0A6C2UPU2_9BACT|nr:glycosyltransferase [Pontiella sulfatireligans]VGO21026.1 Putative glycosyltransferase EpsH [Pontiella sulfatireligans]
MMPLVSICVPTYNGERFLTEALESVEAQIYENCEVVVSDDASSDRTLEIVSEFAARSKYEYRVFNHEPSGIGANWNYCVEHAKGEYIKFLFQDDLLLPDCVREMVSCIKNDSSIGMVFARRKLLLSQAPSVAGIAWCYLFSDPVANWAHKLSQPVSGWELLEDRSLLCSPRNKIGEPPSVLLRRSVFEDIGFFSGDLKQQLDYEYWYRVLAHYKVAFIPDKLTVFRVHLDQATQRNKREKLEEDFVGELLAHVDRSLFHKEVLARAGGKRTWFHMKNAVFFLLKTWVVKLMVLLKILKGQEFLNSPE